jgi:hypothetical protein
MGRRRRTRNRREGLVITSMNKITVPIAFKMAIAASRSFLARNDAYTIKSPHTEDETGMPLPFTTADG